MKKLLLVIAMVAAGFTANAQEGKFNLGAQIGLPTGDASDFTNFTIGLDANYLFNVSEKVDLGVATGYLHYFGKEIGGFSVEDVSFIPLAGAFRFNASEEFVLGGDLGYAIGVSPDGNEGDFYYRPLVGYNLSEKVQLNASYTGIDTGGHFGVGVTFGL